MNSNKEDISILLNKVSSKIGLANSEPTLFDMMGNGSSEILHSSVIGFLINPAAHQGGVACLREFVKKVLKGKVGNFQIDSKVKVETEKDLGPVSINKYPTGGRVDIYVEDENRHLLVIENKIYAGDGDCQLLRYHNSLIDYPHVLIYLTLFGKQPSDKSLGKKNKKEESIDHDDKSLGKNNIKVESIDHDQILTISYSQIAEWLESIQELCSPTIAKNIIEYRNLIKKLIMQEEISQIILSTGENYASAVKITDIIEFARMKLKRKFMDDLNDALANMVLDGYTVAPYKAPDNSKIVGLTLNSKHDNPTFNVLIDWRLYISCNEECLKNDTWEYIGDMNEYNFHDCGAKVKDYLSGNKQENVKKVADWIISKIREVAGKNKRG